MNENSNYTGVRDCNTFHNFHTEINHIDNFSSTENIELRDDLPRNNHSRIETFSYYSVDKFNNTVGLNIALLYQQLVLTLEVLNATSITFYYS